MSNMACCAAPAPPPAYDVLSGGTPRVLVVNVPASPSLNAQTCRALAETVGTFVLVAEATVFVILAAAAGMEKDERDCMVGTSSSIGIVAVAVGTAKKEEEEGKVYWSSVSGDATRRLPGCTGRTIGAGTEEEEEGEKDLERGSGKAFFDGERPRSFPFFCARLSRHANASLLLLLLLLEGHWKGRGESDPRSDFFSLLGVPCSTRSPWWWCLGVGLCVGLFMVVYLTR